MVLGKSIAFLYFYISFLVTNFVEYFLKSKVLTLRPFISL